MCACEFSDATPSLPTYTPAATESGSVPPGSGPISSTGGNHDFDCYRFVAVSMFRI